MPANGVLAMFRFSIRDLLWATLVVAVGLGWWLHYRAVDANRQAVIQHAEKLKMTLSLAKAESEALADDVKFFEDIARTKAAYSYIHRIVKVDWTILDKPIPTAER